MKKISRALVILLALGALFQIGSVLAQTLSAEPSSTSDPVNTDISQVVLDKLNETDPALYDQNVNILINLLLTLNVHERFKQEIERLILEGHTLPDLLIAYEFLYQSFGHMQELESMVSQKETGKTWATVFAEYKKSHKEFIPRAFEPDYLESLTTTSGFTPDYVMLADHLSFVSGTPVNDLIALKLESQISWKQIAADLDILHSASTLPRVQITEEQLTRFATGTFTDQQVAEAFVLAQKLAETPETVIRQMKAGKTEEAIMAESYIEKYN